MDKTYQPASPELLATWHHMMKTYMVKANEADKRLVEHRAFLRSYAYDHGYNNNQTIAFMSTDPSLRAMLDDFGFYSAEIQRFNAMIQAEFAMRSLQER